MLEIAIAGAGAIGREHLARIRANSRCRACAIVDPDPQARERASAGGLAVYPDVASMLAAVRPAGVIVASPNEWHVSVAVPLIAAGVPVLVEKPVADTIEAGQRLVEASRTFGTPVLVGHHRRHGAALAAAKRSIAEGTLGRLVAITANTLLYKPDDYFEVAWRRGPAGGPILINLVHDIDSLRWLAGEITAVTAVSSNRIRGLEVEDTAAVIVEFQSGALGTILLSDTAVAPRSWEHSSGENPSYPRESSQDAVFLAGTHGSLAVPTMEVWTQAEPRSWKEPFLHRRLPIESIDPLQRQLDHFCDVIEGRVPPLIDAADGLATLAATLAVRTSARERRRVEIDTPANGGGRH